MNWPQYLRDFRQQHGKDGKPMSQKSLADALQISTRTVEDWEAGRREPIAFLRLALERLADTMR